jgi:hypothetical protein
MTKDMPLRALILALLFSTEVPYSFGVPLKLAHSVILDPLPHKVGPCPS